ncbi:MAG TPA: cation-translocating P-type ATPase [Burkholderiales bacterium]
MASEGLSAAEAAARLAVEGPNALPGAQKRSLPAVALEVVREPMLLLLLAAAGIYLLIGDLHEALVLAASIAVVIAITVGQELKAERALEALRDLSSPRALVLRDGERRRIAGAEVVRGDLLVLAEGDRVSADARLEDAADLELDESLLTGESLPAGKGAGDGVFSGTLVVKGQGRAIVTATGARSELGRIGVSLAALDSGKTSLERDTARVVKLVAAFALGLSAAMMAAHYALRGGALESVLAGLTLAMAVIPEEFPVVLTVFLALGAWRISRHGVLTRRMPAIEMLGAATVLCVDKTGTLTENRMSVVDTPQAVIDTAALASELEPFDAMDKAIVAACGKDILEQRRRWQLVRDYGMRDDLLAMCHAWGADGALHVAMKGAPETVLRLCGHAELMNTVQGMTGRGLRVLGVAEASAERILDDPRGYRWQWVGFLALADPLRASVPEAVALCRRAGIRVVMITGDFPGTALNIARQAGLDAAEALTGAQLGAMDDAALAAAVRRVNVFARVRPEQKLRLVQGYRAAGEVVAMTGDGVNDAPALKAAHIGIAMGRRGTDVARESAALVLLEDDFGSIVETARLGRRIYENIRNAMRYIISVHVPTAGMAFLPLAFGWPLFLYPVHVVFLEFVIDPACSVVFEAERSERGMMDRPPRDPRARLFSARMLATSLLLGATLLAAVFAAYAWAVSSDLDDAHTRAVGFAAIVFGNLGLIFVNRSHDRLVLETLREPNPALWWIVGGALAALAAAIYAPPLAAIFRFAPLGAAELTVAAAAGLAGVAWYELRKLAARRRR